MDENRMTVMEVLEMTAKTLNEMTIPVRELETIGRTVFGCAKNIQLCIDAIRKEEETKNERVSDPE